MILRPMTDVEKRAAAESFVETGVRSPVNSSTADTIHGVPAENLNSFFTLL